MVVFPRKVCCKFGEVEDLDVVLCFGDEGAARAPPAVVVCFCVVDLVLLLLRGGELEEVLGQGELPVYFFLGEAEVFDVELVGFPSVLLPFLMAGVEGLTNPTWWTACSSCFDNRSFPPGRL